MDLDKTWTEPEPEEIKNQEQHNFPLNLSQSIYPSASKSLQPFEKIQSLPITDELIVPSLQKPDFTSTLLPVVNIKPPPTLFTDPWEENDNVPSEHNETPLVSILKPNQTEEESKKIFLSENTLFFPEETGEATISLERNITQNALWQNKAPILEDIEEDWAEQVSTDFDDLDLFDIDDVLIKQEEILSLHKDKRRISTSSWRQRLEKWGGGVHINWDNAETAEWKILEQLGYTRVPLTKETRDYIIQAARNARLSHKQEAQLTKQLTNTRAQFTRLHLHPTNEQVDPEATRKQALQAKISKIEQLLANQKHWRTIERAVRLLGQNLELDDLMIRDNSLIE